MNKMLNVYVPKPGSYAESAIAKGSGIVADSSREGLPAGTVEIYYEGNLYGACNLTKFEERVLHAADRLVHRYPTAARAGVPIESLIKIGTYDYATRTLDVREPVILEMWLGGDK